MKIMIHYVEGRPHVKGAPSEGVLLLVTYRFPLKKSDTSPAVPFLDFMDRTGFPSFFDSGLLLVYPLNNSPRRETFQKFTLTSILTVVLTSEYFLDLGLGGSIP